MSLAMRSRVASLAACTSASGSTMRRRRSLRVTRSFSGTGDTNRWIAHAHFHLGVIAWVQGDEARARSLLRDAVERTGWASAPADAIDPLRYLGLIACAAGDLDDAAMWFRDELTRLRQYGSRAALAVGLADWRRSPRRARHGSQQCASLPRPRRCSRPRARRSPCRPVITTSGRMAVPRMHWATLLRRRPSPAGRSRSSRRWRRPRRGPRHRRIRRAGAQPHARCQRLPSHGA